MRSVAAAAGTTTPTLYERFAHRDALIGAVIGRGEQELLDVLRPAKSLQDFTSSFIRFACEYPRRFDLTVETFASRLIEAAPQPGFEMLQKLVAEETGARGRQRETLSLAIVSLIFGTVRGMIAAGPDHRRARDLQKACLSALKLLLDAFQRTRT